MSETLIVNLPPEQHKQLLDALDKKSAYCVRTNDARRWPRLPYRTYDAVVHVLGQNGEPTVTFKAPTRNISSNGIAFLFKQMLPIGSTVRLDMPILEDRNLHILARVCRCCHVSGMVHEIGVEFLKFDEDPN